MLGNGTLWECACPCNRLSMRSVNRNTLSSTMRSLSVGMEFRLLSVSGQRQTLFQPQSFLS